MIVFLNRLRSVLLLAIILGVASAFFIKAIQVVTLLRFHSTWFIYGLPLAGVLTVWLYRRYGEREDAGTVLVLDAINHPIKRIRVRLGALIVGNTIWSHLFGASVGGEGTAIQMGAAAGAWVSKKYQASDKDNRMLLLAGMCAGFSGVFGTPLTSCVFIMEMVRQGRWRFRALPWCLLAAFVAMTVCHLLIHVHHFPSVKIPPFGWLILGFMILFGLGCHMAGCLFLAFMGAWKNWIHQWISIWWLRPVLGGVLTIALVLLLGSKDYLGMGVLAYREGGLSISGMFDAMSVSPWAWAWKLVFTALVLGSGFKGGEVTPCFFIGAALGNVFASAFHIPISFGAALGMVGIFGSVFRAPLAGAVLGAELFGWEILPYSLVFCILIEVLRAMRKVKWH